MKGVEGRRPLANTFPKPWAVVSMTGTLSPSGCRCPSGRSDYRHGLKQNSLVRRRDIEESNGQITYDKLIYVDDRSPVLVLGLVVVAHTNFTKVTIMVLIEIYTRAGISACRKCQMRGSARYVSEG